MFLSLGSSNWYIYIHGVVLGIWKLQILMYGINLNYGKCIVIVHNELSYTPRIRECSWGSLGIINRGHCQTWYLSIFLYQHIFKFLKIYPKKCVNRDILNLKYHILDVFHSFNWNYIPIFICISSLYTLSMGKTWFNVAKKLNNITSIGPKTHP